MGYLKGSIAQEEELCRTIIDLYLSLEKLLNEPEHNRKKYIDFIPHMHIFYSFNLSLYRYDGTQSGNRYDFIHKNKKVAPIKISVITAAAPDLRTKSQKEKTELINKLKDNNSDIYSHLFNIIKGIYLVPATIQKNINILILGAFGCGAFSPSKDIQQQINKDYDYTKKIASYFAQYLIDNSDILYLYDYICFAIPGYN